MAYRSWLLVPGTQMEQLGSAIGLGADVVVVDLGESVIDEDKPLARFQAAEWLRVNRTNVIEQRPVGRWVRINSLESGLAREDLNAVMPGAPDGVLLSGAEGPESVRQLAAEIYELEHRHGLIPASTLIVPVAAETARAAAKVPDYLDSSHQRLAGLTWGARALAAGLGMQLPHEADGSWNEVLRHVRAQALLTAHGCGIMAIEALAMDGLEDEAVSLVAAKACQEGFTGMLVRSLDHIGLVNDAFAPPVTVPEEEAAESFAAAHDMEPLSRRTAPAADLSRMAPGFQSRRRAEGLQAENLSAAAILRPA